MDEVDSESTPIILMLQRMKQFFLNTQKSLAVFPSPVELRRNQNFATQN